MSDAVGVSVREAARLVGIGRTKFLEELRNGHGPEMARFGRRVVIPVDALREWLHKRAATSGMRQAA